MTERLVIQRFPGWWRLLSRARLSAPGPGINLTPVGTAALQEISAVDGAHADITDVLRHRLDVHPTHPTHEALWPWAEVEPQVIAAFARVLGTDIEVIRGDAWPAAMTETVVPEP